jgi:alkylation response protein AidB-like acyl-CoA dehydrogenase
MDLELSEDQRELWAVARQVLGDVAPLALARDYLSGGGDAGPLMATLSELGWFAVGTDDDPFGVPGLCLLVERIGAHAAPTTVVDTAVAVRLAREVEQPGALVQAIAAGELATVLAVLESGTGWTLGDLEAHADRVADRYLLSGVKLGVQHGATAAALAVIATHDGSPGVFFVPAGAAGQTLEHDRGLDPASCPATLTLADCAVEPGCALVGEDAAKALEHAFALGAVATAAEGLGAATAAFELAVEYAKERRQFGRPVGQFQALQHVLADAHVARESAWSSVLYAAAALEEGLPEALEASSIAKAHASRASRAVVEASLQALGGIAFTWEHDVHLLQRRVLSCERRFGDAAMHERLLADGLAHPSAQVVA